MEAAASAHAHLACLIVGPGFRTCVEISKENNFDKGVIGIYKKYMFNPLNRTKNVVQSTYSILGQLVATDVNISQLGKFASFVFEEKVRRILYTFLPKNTLVLFGNN